VVLGAGKGTNPSKWFRDPVKGHIKHKQETKQKQRITHLSSCLASGLFFWPIFETSNSDCLRHVLSKANAPTPGIENLSPNVMKRGWLICRSDDNIISIITQLPEPAQTKITRAKST
jgi:hypothetical protein